MITVVLSLFAGDPATGGGWDSGAWTAFFTGVSTLIILVTGIVAIGSMRTVQRTHRMTAFSSFSEYWNRTSRERQWVLESFQFDAANPPRTGSEDAEALRTVINCINEVGLLIEAGLLPAWYVFSLSYADLVRCEAKLRAYMDFREGELGVRYGRRVSRMADRAKRFHDSKPMHRANPIMVRPAPGALPEPVYETSIRRGVSGWMQRGDWWVRRHTNRY